MPDELVAGCRAESEPRARKSRLTRASSRPLSTGCERLSRRAGTSVPECRDRRPEPAGLVGEDNGLGAVTEAELGEDARDVRLDCRRPNEQALADFRVARTSGDAVTTSRSRSVRRSRRTDSGEPTARRSANWPMSRFVIDGASSAPPSATVRTAATSSAGGIGEPKPRGLAWHVIVVSLPRVALPILSGRQAHPPGLC